MRFRTLPRIRVFGGSQLRPNIHIQDMVRAYHLLLESPAATIDGRTFNVGFQNRSVSDLAGLVFQTLDDPSVVIDYEPSDDLRSYHVNSDRIRSVLGFEAVHTIEDAIRDLQDAFEGGRMSEPLTNPAYYNIRTMQLLNLG